MRCANFKYPNSKKHEDCFRRPGEVCLLNSFIERMEERKGSMLPRHRLFACVIKQYGTGLYRAWVRLGGSQAICLGAHLDEAKATETIDHFLETYQEGRIQTLEDVLIYLDGRCAQDQTASLPVIDQRVGEMIV